MRALSSLLAINVKRTPHGTRRGGRGGSHLVEDREQVLQLLGLFLNLARDEEASRRHILQLMEE